MLYERIAGLELDVSSHSLEGLESTTQAGWTRRTTVVRLAGAGLDGVGEDVSYDEPDQTSFLEHGVSLDLRGRYTVESFSRALDGLALFPETPASPANALYRRWAFESAALDLALRQAGFSLPERLGRTPRLVRYVVSLGLGDPPSDAGLRDILRRHPGTGFKVDLADNWDDSTLERLADVGTVATVDLKGQYHGNFTGPAPDAEMYRKVAERLPGVWIEDPASSGPAWDALAPWLDRITWDANLHSLADIVQLSVIPKCINVKPSRFGFLSELMRVYEYCENRGIAMYGGGQFELGPGRAQIQQLAALFHPYGANDVAPGGFNLPELPEDLPESPLPASAGTKGFGG